MVLPGGSEGDCSTPQSSLPTVGNPPCPGPVDTSLRRLSHRRSPCVSSSVSLCIRTVIMLDKGLTRILCDFILLNYLQGPYFQVPHIEFLKGQGGLRDCPTHKRPSPLPALQRPAFSPFPWLSPHPLAHPGPLMSTSVPSSCRVFWRCHCLRKALSSCTDGVALFCFLGLRHSSQGHLRKCVSHSVLLSRGPAPPESRPGDSRNQATW